MAFSDNLRRLRQGKQMTQEQVAEALGVSPQSVSRWECGNTFPDVMLLPSIARLYGVTVDDLYREDAVGYKNYAQRLLAVYEASGRSEDFFAAEQEFVRMGTNVTADDLRSWGVLYHYMMNHCAALAQQKLEEAESAAERGDWVRYAAAQQRSLLLCDLGRGEEVVRQYEEELHLHPSDANQWRLCAAANYFVGKFERALELARLGAEQFPENAALHIYAGDACRELKWYEDAFFHWQRARELDNTYLDVAFSMAFCHEELEQYESACQIWTEIHRELLSRGLPVEAEFPARQAEACREKTSFNRQ